MFSAPGAVSSSLWYWISTDNKLHLSPIKESDSYTEAADILTNPTAENIPWYNNENIVSIEISTTSTYAKIKPTSMAHWFRRLSNCTTITGLNDTYIDASELTSLEYTFASSGFTSLDLKGLTTSAVTKLDQTFGGCRALETLDLTGNFKTSAVESMKLTFAFIGQNTTSGCQITFPQDFDVQDVSTMQQIFQNVKVKNGSNVGELDISSFHTSSKLTVLTGAFYNAAYESTPAGNLNNIIFGEKLNTTGLVNLNQAFLGYSGTQLDLTPFSNSALSAVVQTFANCSSLTTIYADPNK